MSRAVFFDQVRRHFGYLVDECGFSLVREQALPGFLNSEVVWQSEDCRLSVVLERDEVYVYAGPLSPEEEWYDLYHTARYLEQGTTDWKHDFAHEVPYPAAIEVQVTRMAAILRRYVPRLCELFRAGIFEAKRAELQDFMRRAFDQAFTDMAGKEEQGDGASGISTAT